MSIPSAHRLFTFCVDLWPWQLNSLPSVKHKVGIRRVAINEQAQPSLPVYTLVLKRDF